MFEESQDVTAAENAFQGIFESADKEAKKKAVIRFVEHFLAAYRGKGVGPSSVDPSIEEALKFVCAIIEAAKSRDQLFDQAELLGRGLGIYLRWIEKLPEWKKSISETSVLNENKKIADALQAWGMKIKRKFIEKEILKIMQKHAGKMSKGRQGLIARMAAAFV
ncbi:MAG TPA: hypothetical protein VJC16_03510 [Candidatus Nanoarchaeia archaeon]|nr:hypothetical protein [Candidatus Nanoarchaeia archaeon]